MSGRPVQRKADIPALKKIIGISNIVDYQPLVVYIMRKAGCTFAEISEALELSRQQAHTLFENAEKVINEL